jgi:chromosomal replication initiation ATPase DnaA
MTAHLQERTGIVEEGIERRSKFAKFIDRRVDDALASTSMQARISKLVDQRIKAEIDAIVARRVEEEQRALAKLNPVEDRPSIATIVSTCADVTQIHAGDLLGPRRPRSYAWARQFTMWVAHHVRKDLSTNGIGKPFNRDHTTVLHAYAVIEERIDAGVEPVASWIADPRIKKLLGDE